MRVCLNNNINTAVMNRQLSFQEHRDAFAARHGRFVDMHEDDNSSSLRTPVASVTASFDTLDERNPTAK
jgi:hypothetical protein